jgi:hypothetical protein
MTATRVVLAIFFALLVAVGLAGFDDEPWTMGPVILGLFAGIGGGLAVAFSRKPTGWKTFVFLQLPMIGLLVWNLTRFEQDVSLPIVVGWAIAMAATIVAINVTNARASKNSACGLHQQNEGQNKPQHPTA